jgi:predicted nucleotidyltransferase
MTPEEERAVRPVIDLIVERFNPVRVILFGSRARGQAHRYSDYDLLVVEDATPFGSERTDRVGDLHVELGELNVPPMDVLLHTQAEFDQWRTGRNNVIARAAREGEVVYERR